MIKDFAKKSGAYYLDYFKVLNDGNNGIIKEYSKDDEIKVLDFVRFKVGEGI